MTNRTLETRVRRIEAQRRPATPMQATVIMAATKEEAARIRAEHEAAGTYRPDWPLVVVISEAFQDR